jgi:hypothetical protein
MKLDLKATLYVPIEPSLARRIQASGVIHELRNRRASSSDPPHLSIDHFDISFYSRGTARSARLDRKPGINDNIRSSHGFRFDEQDNLFCDVLSW